MSAVNAVFFDMFSTMAQDDREHWDDTFADVVREQKLTTTVASLRAAWDAGSANFRIQRNTPGAPFLSYLEGWTEAFNSAFRELGVAGDGRAASQQAIDNLAQRPIYPETQEVLELIGRGRRIAVISNADDASLQPIVARIGADFETVVSSEAGRCYKPNPSLFRWACRQLALDPAQCAYVGDKQFEDVQGARGVGMAAIWINRAGVARNPELPTPDAEIRSLRELPAALDRLEGGPDGLGVTLG